MYPFDLLECLIQVVSIQAVTRDDMQLAEQDPLWRPTR